jgi:hypothetical protein
MSFAPYIAIWFLLLVAGGLSWLFQNRTAARIISAIALTAVTFLTWFIIRPPQAGPPATLSWLGWQWSVGPAEWALTGAILLVALVSLTHEFFVAPNQNRNLPGLLLGLSACTLPVVWAGNAYTLVFFLALWVACWAAAYWKYGAVAGVIPKIIIRRHVVAVFIYWFAAVVPPSFLTAASLLAFLLLGGAWPFDGPRRTGESSSTSLGLILMAYPIIVAGSVFIDIIGSPALSDAQILVFTVIGIFSLLGGLIRLWGEDDLFTGLGGALATALVGIILLAGLWAGQDALIAAIQVAVFLPILASLLFTPVSVPPAESESGISDNTSVRRLRAGVMSLFLLVLGLTLAGLPPTAGFRSISALYGSWIQNGGYVLLLVTAIVLSVWLGTLLLLGNRLLRQSSNRPQRFAALQVLPMLLAVIGLLRIDTSLLVSTPMGVWLALVLPLVAGILLVRFVPNFADFLHLIPDSLTVDFPLGDYRRRVGSLADRVAGAANDAARILEGDQGLLWILGLLILLLWIS